MPDVEDRLTALGITLPEPATPVANYVPWRRVGNLLYVSGQICLGPDGVLNTRHKGKLGGTVSAEHGTEAAKFCAINLLAQAKAALGSLDKVKSCVRLGGFIAATPGFMGLPAVMNGASDLMVAAFGDAGKHARTTVAAPVLPLDCAVEVDAIFEIAS
jgi:enamine deaminase RidA (YjgF/YER057c/UK114 family)